MGEKLEALWILPTRTGFKVFRSRSKGRAYKRTHRGCGKLERGTWGSA